VLVGQGEVVGGHKARGLQFQGLSATGDTVLVVTEHELRYSEVLPPADMVGVLLQQPLETDHRGTTLAVVNEQIGQAHERLRVLRAQGQLGTEVLAGLQPVAAAMVELAQFQVGTGPGRSSSSVRPKQAIASSSRRRPRASGHSRSGGGIVLVGLQGAAKLLAGLIDPIHLHQQFARSSSRSRLPGS